MDDVDPKWSDAERLVALARGQGIDAWRLCGLLDIAHDRTNNGGIPEVIELALQDDDPEWIEHQIMSA